MNSNRMLILASKSSIRAELLRSANIQFEVHSSHFDEEAYKTKICSLPYSEQAIELAKQKALYVSKKFPEAVIIGADQICELEGQVLSKPYNKEVALKQLEALSGKTHSQHSGVCLVIGSHIIWSHCETSNLTMRLLSKEEKEKYLSLDSPYDSCGSYRFENHGHQLFSRIEGDHNSILGLPLFPLLKAFNESV